VKHLGLLTLLVLLAGCALPQRKVADAKPAFRAMGESISAEQPRSDEAIGFEVRRQLDLIGAGATAGIIVEVNDGVVTLRGAATTVAASWRAQGVAQAVKGVRQVVNLIIVPGGSASPATGF
jgi:osmotically-inducible protein OsmY